MPLHSGKIRQNAQKYLFLQEIINSKTKDMKMNFVKNEMACSFLYGAAVP
mgnify:CR=1 FL=1|jgi:hypothetical protein